MAWIEVHQELREHKKLYACAELLKVSRVEMLGTIVALWLWALDNVPDGSLCGISTQTIARVCDWNIKKADVLVNALISTGWLDKTGDVLTIHDWMDYAGKLMDRRRKDKERKKKGKDISQISDGIPVEIQQMSTEIPVLQYPNRTIPLPSLNNSAPNTVDGSAHPQEPPAPFDGKSFTLFWEAYPNKVDRNAAWEAWQALRPDPATAKTILQALTVWKASSGWADEGGRYIPQASNFLSKGHWKSPPIQQPATKPKREPDADEQAALRRMMEEPL